jgi:hypothetical protein
MESTLDSTRLKERVDVAALSDLKAYFQTRNLNLDVKDLKVILGAAMPGGTFTTKQLPARLERILPRDANHPIADFSTDIYFLLQEKRSDLNYIRYTLNAVSRVLGDLYKLSREQSIHGLPPEDELRIKNKLAVLMNAEVSIRKDLADWTRDVCNLYMESSQLIQDASKKNQGSSQKSDSKYEKVVEPKVDLTSISTKSISTYILRLREYAIYKFQDKVTNEQVSSLQLIDFGQRVSRYFEYTSPVNLSMLKELKEVSQYEEIFKLFNEKKSLNSVNSKSKVVTIKERLPSKRIAIIKFSGTIIEDHVIQPVLRSLKSQLRIMPDQKIFLSSAETETDYLSVSVEGLRWTDLEPLRHILESHAS